MTNNEAWCCYKCGGFNIKSSKLVEGNKICTDCNIIIKLKDAFKRKK